MKSAWVLAFLALLLGAAGLTVYQRTREPGKQSRATPASRPVSRVMLREIEVADFIQTVGTVRERQAVHVSSQQVGLRILWLAVRTGDWVRVGQPLARLESEALDAQQRAAKARVLSARAQLDKAREPFRPQEVRVQQASLEQARANRLQQLALLREAEASFELARSTHTRYRQAYAEGLISSQDLAEKKAEDGRQRQAVRSAEARLETAQHELEAAKARLSLARAGGRQEDVQQSLQAVRESEANLEELESRRRETVLCSPVSGLVVERRASLGGLTSQEPLYSIARGGELEVEVELPAARAEQTRPGTPAEIQSDGRIHLGKVDRLEPRADAITHLIGVRIRVLTPSNLRSGQFVKVSWSGTPRRIRALPSTCVRGPASLPYVLVVEEGRARKRSVRLGRRHESWCEVLSGIERREQVVAEGGAFLQDGEEIR